MNLRFRTAETLFFFALIASAVFAEGRIELPVVGQSVDGISFEAAAPNRAGDVKSLFLVHRATGATTVSLWLTQAGSYGTQAFPSLCTVRTIRSASPETPIGKSAGKESSPIKERPNPSTKLRSSLELCCIMKSKQPLFCCCRLRHLLLSRPRQQCIGKKPNHAEVQMKHAKQAAAALAILTMVAIGCSTIGSSGKYYGVLTTGKNIAFVVDVSGSMEGKNEGNITDQLRAQATQKAANTAGNAIGGTVGGLLSRSVARESTKLASVKRELGPAIRGLDATSRFTIITFSDSASFWKDDLVSPTSGTTSEASLFVERLDSSGGTAALAGLRAAFAVHSVDTIFFLSDGYPSDAPADKILAEVKSMNSGAGIVIHAIGVGDDKDEQFMRNLAGENGGKYAEG